MMSARALEEDMDLYCQPKTVSVYLRPVGEMGARATGYVTPLRA
jgi:hypothetical protein